MIAEEKKIARIAAGLAILNIGFSPDDAIGKQIFDHIADNSDRWMPTAWAEVCTLAGHLMESDLHEETFCEEAARWEDEIKKTGLATYMTQPWYQSDRYEWMRQIVAIT